VSQATLIALYGTKPPAFEEILNQCFAMIAVVPGIQFKPYSISQIHATLIGLEKAGKGDMYNKNIFNFQGRHEAMDVNGFLQYLTCSDLLPLRISIGNYASNDARILSRGQLPYQRSFSIQGDKVVIMGWPSKRDNRDYGHAATNNAIHRAGSFHALGLLRKKAEQYNIQHLYHKTDEEFDNDLYIRIGTIDEKAQTKRI